MGRQFDYKLFDLEPRDILVYETMLRHPDGMSVRALADKVKMNRGTTFEVIKKLVGVGIVTSHYKLSRKYYAPQDPAFLAKYAEERSAAVAEEVKSVERYVKGLEKLQAVESYSRFSQLYEGDEEIALLLHDVLNTVAATGDKTYRVISSAEVRNHMYKKFENFTRQRIKRRITARVIGVGTEDELRPLADRKWLGADEIPACYLIIYGGKVAQISLSKNGVVQGTVVENPGVTAMHELLFDTLWDKL